MEKIKTLKKVLVYDRLLRFNIDLLTGIKMEIKADIEEARILSEALLNSSVSKRVADFLSKVEKEFLLKLEEVLDEIYDEYEIFNFDITFLSSIPDEVGREIERLDLVTTLNKKLELLKELLNEACCSHQENRELEAIMTPFRVYCELLNHGIEFNKKFENM